MNKIHNVTCIIGTRPEALKMAPVIVALRQKKNIRVSTVITAQHRGLLDQILAHFDIKISTDFDIMMPNQQLTELTSRLLDKFSNYLKTNPCDLIVAQGDTTTTMVAALSSFYNKIPFAHVEAGLRTSDVNSPFPEELNRRIASQIATMHFCPTQTSKKNLEKEGICENVFVTGNTIIDTLYSSTKDLVLNTASNKKIILVTCHRRENFGKPLENVCSALIEIIKQHPDVHIVFPVHPNPNVQKMVYEKLGSVERIQLTEPLDYKELTKTLAESFLVLTDSGGLQEEAPALQKPVLILRNETERPEGVDCGAAKIAGTRTQDIINLVNQLLTKPEIYEKMRTAGSPYGDGTAAKKIANIISHYLTPEHPSYLSDKRNMGLILPKIKCI